MSGFSVDHMKHKLSKLTCAPDSIQTMSLWILHHQKHHVDEITSTWLNAICKETNPTKIINLMYLANDAIQNCKKKCPEFSTKFFIVLEPALRHCSKIPNREIADKNRRILGIFKQREIYKADKISRLENALVGKRMSVEEPFNNPKPSPIKYSLENINVVCADVTDSLRKMIDPPSEDGETRQKLLNCPDIVGNPDKLVTIRSEAEVDDYLQQLKSLEEPSKEYCKKLTAEMEQRRFLQKQLDTLLANVRAAVEYQESTLREVKKREDAVKHCVDQIQKVYESLPDLDQMNTSQPLPSADVLFSAP